MSYFIDIKYLGQISHRLPLFAQKKRDLWNCRCIICGDSTTNKKKARGYFYRTKNDLYYKCHNCAASQHFGTFLKTLDPTLYQQYVFERYAQGENGPKAHKTAEPMLMNFVVDEMKFEKSIHIEQVAQRLDTLPDDNEAVIYCKQRGIPVEKYSQLFYISSVKDIQQIAPDYTSIKTTEPRLVLPFYNELGQLTGVTMRALRGESLRYIMIKFIEDAPLIFGLNNIDKTKNINVVEGPIDSLFLDNSIACNGTSFGKLETLDLPKDNITVIVDNQPRNIEVCKIVEKYISLNYNIVIWPCDMAEKDINDMAQNRKNVRRIIKENTYQGLMAQLKFTEWRNC